MFTLEDFQSSQAADVNQILGHLTGYGIVEGGVPSDGARPWAVDILNGRTYINGEPVDIPATSLVLNRLEPEELHPGDRTDEGDVPAELVSQDDPRKAIIYVAEGGDVRVAFGTPKEPKPRGATRFDTYEPSPPDLKEDVVPIAEVWIGGNAQQIATDDIRDRRLNSQIDLWEVSAEEVSSQTLVDGSGQELDSLADVQDAITEERVTRVLSEDENHGSDAPHDYWSGDHEDLTNVAENDHHVRYEDDEAVESVRGELDLSELSPGEEVTPGYHLITENGAPSWESPPMAEAPLLQSGTVTHTGGSSTTHIIENITPLQGAYLEVGVNVSVESPPSWDGDYAFSVETVRQWGDGQGGINAEIDLTWDIDPGEGNDLEVRYQVYEMSPDIVSSVYEHSDAVGAVAGAEISPGILNPWEEFRIPQYSSPTDAPEGSLGDIIISSDGEGETGLFVYNNSQWHGPFQSGLSALSGLVIDGDKDWGGYSIRDIGLGTNLDDALQMGNINTHAAVSGVHHQKTTSEEIDHADVSNQTPDDHHAPYQDGEALDAAARSLRAIPITATVIPNSGSISTHAAIGPTERLVVERIEFYNESHSVPSSLMLVIEDLDRDERYFEQYEKLWKGDLVTIEGEAQVEFKIQNYTGGEMAAGAMILGYMEEI